MSRAVSGLAVFCALVLGWLALTVPSRMEKIADMVEQAITSRKPPTTLRARFQYGDQELSAEVTQAEDETLAALAVRLQASIAEQVRAAAAAKDPGER